MPGMKNVLKCFFATDKHGCTPIHFSCLSVSIDVYPWQKSVHLVIFPGLTNPLRRVTRHLRTIPPYIMIS